MGWFMNKNLIRKMALLKTMRGAKNHGHTVTSNNSNNGTANGVTTKASFIARPLTEQQASMWVKSMKHSDGSTGELITMEQAKEWLAKKGYTGMSLPDFYAVINAMKSDYNGVAKMFNIMSDDFYGELARAFIQDKDAKPYKTSLYREYIAM